MNLKATPELKLVVMGLTIPLATLPVYFINGWHKWLMGAAILIVGIVIENRIERAYLAAEKSAPLPIQLDDG